MHRQGKITAQACDSMAPALLLAITSFRFRAGKPKHCRSSEIVNANKLTVNEKFQASRRSWSGAPEASPGAAPEAAGAGESRARGRASGEASAEAKIAMCGLAGDSRP